MIFPLIIVHKALVNTSIGLPSKITTSAKAHAHRADDILTAVRIAGEFGLGMTLDQQKLDHGHRMIRGYGCQNTMPAQNTGRLKRHVLDLGRIPR